MSPYVRTPIQRKGARRAAVGGVGNVCDSGSTRDGKLKQPSR